MLKVCLKFQSLQGYQEHIVGGGDPHTRPGSLAPGPGPRAQQPPGACDGLAPHHPRPGRPQLPGGAV